MLITSKTTNERKRKARRRSGGEREGGGGGLKEPFILTSIPPLFFSFLRSQNNATLIATVCSMKRHNIWTAPPARARVRSRPRPPAGYAPPLLDKYAPSQHSQYRIQLRLIVFSAGTGVKERQTPRRVLTRHLCSSARRRFENHDDDGRRDSSKSVYNEN